MSGATHPEHTHLKPTTTTAPGVVTRGTPDQILMYFAVEGSQLLLRASIDTTIIPFVSENATLTYTSKAVLKGSVEIASGSIGTSTFTFKLNDGTKIEGAIKESKFAKQSTIGGNGKWITLDGST